MLILIVGIMNLGVSAELGLEVEEVEAPEAYAGASFKDGQCKLILYASNSVLCTLSITYCVVIDFNLSSYDCFGLIGFTALCRLRKSV